MPPWSCRELEESLATLVRETKQGKIRWEGVYHPVDGDLMVLKGVRDGQEGFYYLGDEEEDGGPSLSDYADDEDMHADALILCDYLRPENQGLLRQLVALVKQKVG